MINKFTLSLFGSFLALSTTLPSINAERLTWPRQQNLSKAYESLERASTAVEKSKLNRADMRLTNAILELTSAKRFLNDAKKNKGSSRIVAIKAIEQAEKDLATAEANPAKLDSVQESINKALKEVSDSAKAGR